MVDMMGKLEQLAKPLAEYLRENHHPHTAIVVTDDRVVVVEGMVSVPLFAKGIEQIPTCDLVAELKTREGVGAHMIGPGASITVREDGPAIVLSVID